MNERERKLVDGLGRILESRYKKIEIRRRPALSPIVRESLQSVLGYEPILQPEIDMIIWEKSKVVAVEVKVFAPPRMRSFYEGIGQALALHRFGFDYAALWLLFIGTNKDDLKRGSTAWEFVRDKLKLSLDFNYFLVRTVNDNLENCEFIPMQYLGSLKGYELGNINDVTIKNKYSNPIRDEYEQQVIRKMLELWFNKNLTVERLKDECNSLKKPSFGAPPKKRPRILPTGVTSSTAELLSHKSFTDEHSNE